MYHRLKEKIAELEKELKFVRENLVKEQEKNIHLHNEIFRLFTENEHLKSK